MEHNKDSEAVYVAHEDSHVVMNEKVQALAGSIYQEFERMMSRYDEDVVKELMPLVVNVLEALDLSYTENQEHEVELELLREDNEQLVTQYEREKALRKTTEQKLLCLEDETEERTKELTNKIESLEAITRVLELKSKNSSDHVSRLEEKEGESKREYNKLHERYTELFKTHMDHMERTKILMGNVDPTDPFSVGKRLSTTSSFGGGFGSISGPGTGSVGQPQPIGDLNSPTSPIAHSDSSPQLQMDDPLSAQLAAANGEQGNEWNRGNTENVGTSEAKKEERSGNLLYQEFSFQEPDLPDESPTPQITGSWVHPGEYASSVNDNFFGMGKEVENLILENNELLATKNALNIVKDDLIAKVDELTSEQEILREEVSSLNALKTKLRARVSELEEELKRLKEETEKDKGANKSGGKSDEEDDVPLAQRKRFTRVEMARVLMERNQYKERFMELQDAVRWTEMLRAARQDPSFEKRSNGGFLNFFSKLFSNKTASVGMGLTTDRLVSSGGITHSSPTKSIEGPKPTTEMSGERSQLRRLPEPHTSQRRDLPQYKQIRAHVRKDDGRMQAYGWSLPARSSASTTSHGSDDKGVVSSSSSTLTHPSGATDSQRSDDGSSIPSTGGKQLPVPVPIYCRPFMEASPSMKMFCAAGVPGPGPDDISHVWICTATHSVTRVSIIDANRPADILHHFDVSTSQLLCIAYVPAWDELEDLESASAENNEGSKDESKELEPEDENEQTDLTSLSKGATVWFGSETGSLYIHPAVKKREQCIHKLKLADSILSIVHVNGVVAVAMANGTVAMLQRHRDTGLWNFDDVKVLDLEGIPHISVRCLCAVEDTVWCGFRNRIHVLSTNSLSHVKTFEAHPRKESQVRQMACAGVGVWVSIRLDSTLRLYHGTTYEHLQDVDIEPYVSKMLGTGKLGFSYARITALLVSCQRLWIGTGNGVIISVPLTLSQPPGGSADASPGASSKKSGPGCALRVFSSSSSAQSIIPYCSMSQAQLSFHGHRDVVKYFVSVPGCRGTRSVPEEGGGDAASLPTSGTQSTLVISGGEGYIDFRVVEEGDGDTATHLIVWKLSNPTI